VPAEQVTAGQPLQLRVAHRDGAPFSFFQIKGRQDTAAFEHLTLQSAAALAAAPADEAAAPAPTPAAPGT